MSKLGLITHLQNPQLPDFGKSVRMMHSGEHPGNGNGVTGSMAGYDGPYWINNNATSQAENGNDKRGVGGGASSGNSLHPTSALQHHSGDRISPLVIQELTHSPRMAQRRPLLSTTNITTVRATRVRVEICVVFLKIGEIDTLKEQYEADVMIKAIWREPALDRDKKEVASSVDFSQYWNPKIFIENTIGDPKESMFQMISYNDKGQAYILQKRRIKGTFLENLELDDFPFDVQDLTVTIMSDLNTHEIDLVEDTREPHMVNRQSFIDEQEWHLYKYVETEMKEVSNEYEDPSIKKPALLVKCRAARRPAYFFWNIFLITFLICSMSFTTFAVQRNLPQNRLQLSFTLVLTTVAFKFVVNQSLPKISYLTYLDKYVLVAMILLTGVCAWHGITTLFGNDPHGIVDLVALVVIAVLYIGFNIGFALRIYMQPGKKRRRMEFKEKEYMEKIDRHMQSQHSAHSSPGIPYPATSI